MKFLLWVMTVVAASAAMPVEQQNAAVQTYCAVCHTDAHPNGGLTLQHFDAAHPDPGVAAMMASKLRTGALGASGKPLPDRATERALLDALVAESAGADRWVVTEAPLLTASIVRPASTDSNRPEPDLYRLSLTCRPGAGQAEMQLAWSPDVAEAGKNISAVLDEDTRRSFTVGGAETMGNGAGMVSGPGSVILSAIPIPSKSLIIGSVFRNDSVAFPFDELDPAARRSLSKCFDRRSSTR